MKLLLLAMFVMLSVPMFADKAVKGHTRKDGTVVQPHHRTNGNKTETDNYGTKGNSNPHTGKSGTRTPKK
jgi:hypothetical protein